jgi:pimeloyl-ACP methyl ester carboxylesterase
VSFVSAPGCRPGRPARKPWLTCQDDSVASSLRFNQGEWTRGRSPSGPRQPGGRAGRTAMSTGLLATELPRAGLELGVSATASPLLAAARRGGGQPVLVLPGFLQSDASTLVLRSYLRWLNYSVHGWQLPANLGSTDSVVRGLRSRVVALKKTYGQRVTIIGWSLGGLYAHELARHAPGSVQQVVTLGTPVQLAGRRGRAASLAFDRLSQLHVAPPLVVRPWRESGGLRVPATSVYSRSDGIAPWKACRLSPGRKRENIEVYGSHLGLVHNPSVLLLLADRLAQPEDSWRPFAPGRLMRWAYP